MWAVRSDVTVTIVYTPIQKIAKFDQFYETAPGSGKFKDSKKNFTKNSFDYAGKVSGEEVKVIENKKLTDLLEDARFLEVDGAYYEYHHASVLNWADIYGVCYDRSSRTWRYNYTGLVTGWLDISDVVNLYYVAHTKDSEHHLFNKQLDTVAPTCTEKGYTVYQCAYCEKTETRDETAINPNNHDWDIWVHNKEAEKDASTHTRVCTRDTSHTETAPCTFVEKDDKSVCSVCGGTYDGAPKTYTVSYDANGGNAQGGLEGFTSPYTVSVSENDDHTVLGSYWDGNDYTRVKLTEEGGNFQAPDGCVFTGWLDEVDAEDKTDDRIYHFGDKIENVNRDITLKAVWEPAAKVKVVKTAKGLDDLSTEELENIQYDFVLKNNAQFQSKLTLGYSKEDSQWSAEFSDKLLGGTYTLEETFAPHISGYVWKEAKYRVEQGSEEADPSTKPSMSKMEDSISVPLENGKTTTVYVTNYYEKAKEAVDLTGAVSIRHEVNQGTTPDWCTGDDSAYHVIAAGDASVSYQIAVDLSKMTLTEAGAAQLNQYLTEDKYQTGHSIWDVMQTGSADEFGGSWIELHVQFPDEFKGLTQKYLEENLTSDHAWFTVVRVENEENDTTGLNWVISLSIPDRECHALLALEEPPAEETPETKTPGDQLTLSGITLELKDTLAKGGRVDLRTAVQAGGTLYMGTAFLQNASETEPVAVNLIGGDFVELLLTGTASNRALIRREGEKEGKDSNTYHYVLKKVDAEDGHALKDAKFGLYADDKQIATATSGSKGYARFSLDERVYNKLDDKNDDLYVMELTAPDGYVKSSRKYDVSFNAFVKNSVIGAEEYAITVTNSRSSTPDRLNDEDHFAYVIGYKDGNVRPYGLISRAETTTIFFRLLKDSVRDGNLLTSNTYTDVADNYWANTAISTMTGLGIVQGRTATTFDPYAPITRAQFAAICARFDDGKTQGGQTFTDIQGHWAQAYIERAAELGWIKGFEDGTFRPDTYITRAQAMTMINRVLNRIPEDADDLLSNMNVWPDCNPGDWFYLAVQEATNSHDYKHKAGNYETWSSMNKDPDWTRYEN